MIFVVLGMHKSGTTLVSQILHHSGINMGEFDENVSYDKGNKYERESTLALDLDILGTDNYDVLGLSGQAVTTLNDQQKSQMLAIVEDCQKNHTNWGFKDPRACLIYDLWADNLPEHKIIAVYRDPAEVWPRFKWLGLRKHHTNFHRAYDYLLRWLEHNRNIIRFVSESPREALVIRYADLMHSDNEFRKLQDFVGVELNDRRQSGLYRSRFKPDFFLKAAEWYLEKFKGLSCKKTLAQLDKLR